MFRGSALSYAVLLKGNRGQMETMTRRCVELIEQRCAGSETLVDWYVAVGMPTERLSSLPHCYAAANHALAYRHLMPNTHILKTEMTERSGKLSAYSAADQGRLDPTLIQRFIQNGLETEIEDFTNEFFDGLGEACESLMFRHYLLLSARINALAAAEKLGLEREELAKRLPQPELDAPLKLRSYFTQVLRCAIAMRDEESIRQSGGIVDSAIEYIDLHYTEENISLNTVARAINVSTNYLSAVFSQKMGLSFVEYLTQKRMARARQLLRQRGKRSGEVAAEVGYRDPRYFSFVFKKTQGCTPREYRAGEAEK